MTKEEILRRLQAICAMEREKRPFTVRLLGKLAGMAHYNVFHTAAGRRPIGKKAKLRLERALTQLENAEVVIKRHGSKRHSIEFVPPKPPQENIPRVRLGPNGPVMEWVAVNPNTFPVLDAVNKQGV